ncbi:hypothetical protein ACE1CI_33295 [Aerosakkonemataceae cyanobacterium BLCC-F50]|uniref:DUF4384 domain-containing protein n=1 Tax=Floridaenema flaviceps BLCC-F50 TaxID=3153642 RepID=A0ABV4Y1E8_9CYAN
MTPVEVKFLNEITLELKTQQGFNLREEVFFPLRYDKNRPVIFEHRQIAEELMPKDPRLGKGDYATSIGTTSQNVVQAMVNLYKEEMEKHEVNIDILLNGKQGQRGTWRKAYDWLWNHKYLRWLDANSWEILQEKAKFTANWLQFLTGKEMVSVQRGTRALILPPPPPSVQKITPTIPAKESLWMVINLELNNYQLLLLNRSQQGQCLLCPSSAYAPNSIIEKPPILLPQKNAWAGNSNEKFVFGEVGKEEFLAIMLEKPLSLPWLTPREDEALPEWNAKRIKELFEQLEKQGNWQVFYQSFEVVE